MHQSLSANRADLMLDVRVKDLCPGRLLFVLYRIAFRGARKAEKLKSYPGYSANIALFYLHFSS